MSAGARRPMSASAHRRSLAAIGCDLVALDGGPGERRGQALLRRLSGTPGDSVELGDLATVPDWLRLPRPAQRRIAQRAALLSMAPALAGTIDGHALRAHAEVAGEEALDWAIDHADALPTSGLPPVAADALDARGLALMQAALPAALRPLLAPGAERIDPPAAVARACVATALEDPAA